MVKGISVLETNKFTTLQDRNICVRWIMEKETASDEIASDITTYFLQQKIKPDEPDTAKKVLSAHKMLFLLVAIKQTVDLKVLNDFYQEWESFKLMFHIEGYKCKVSQAKLKKWQSRQEAIKTGQPVPEEDNDEDHDHND